MDNTRKERVWNKLSNLSGAIDKANDQIHNLKDYIRRNEDISNRYANLLRLKTALDSALLELENLPSKD
jgi:hypothetical protein